MIVQSWLQISNFIYALMYLILLTGSGAETCLLTVQSRLTSKQPQWPASGTACCEKTINVSRVIVSGCL